MSVAARASSGKSPAASWLSAEIFALAQSLGVSPESANTLAALVGRLAETASENGETHLKITRPADFDFLKNATGTEPLRRIAGTPERILSGEKTPLVFEEKNAALYFFRHYKQEICIAENLLERAQNKHSEPSSCAEKIISESRPFPLNAEQRAAVRAVISSPLAVISGGPGTGKTTLLLRALICLYAENPETKILLVAPTGKAASRMKEAIRDQIAQLSRTESESFAFPPNALKKAETLEPKTLHRVLKTGVSPVLMPAPRPISADCVIVDEASMVDQAIMFRLLESLHPQAKLVLLGDKNQLDSVGAGQIFGALCAADELRDVRVELSESRRFNERGTLGALARAIVSGNVPAAEKLLDACKVSGSAPSPFVFCEGNFSSEAIDSLLREIFPEKLRRVPADASPEEMLALIDSARVLSPLRHGNFGAEKINARARRLFAPTGTAPDAHFHGQPILITRSAPRERLFNGDVGVVLRDAESGAFSAYFRAENGELRRVPAALLPEHETAYAMSIHKSQGSEFTRLAVVFPEADALAEFLSRQLLYTAVTRFREAGNSAKFILFYDRKTLLSAVAHENPMRELLFVNRNGRKKAPALSGASR